MRLANVQDVRVTAQVVLGDVDLSLGEISALSEGSIIELQRLAGEPVDLVASGEIIARGEVVVIDENFGIRLVKMVKTAEGGAS